MNGLGLSGGENGGDEGAAFRGEELDGEEEDDGEQEKSHWTEKLRDPVCDGFSSVSEEEGNENYQCNDDDGEYDTVRRRSATTAYNALTILIHCSMSVCETVFFSFFIFFLVLQLEYVMEAKRGTRLSFCKVQIIFLFCVFKNYFETRGTFPFKRCLR